MVSIGHDFRLELWPQLDQLAEQHDRKTNQYGEFRLLLQAAVEVLTGLL